MVNWRTESEDRGGVKVSTFARNARGPWRDRLLFANSVCLYIVLFRLGTTLCFSYYNVLVSYLPGHYRRCLS